jgi:uncharacterized membrane protein YkoI
MNTTKHPLAAAVVAACSFAFAGIAHAQQAQSAQQAQPAQHAHHARAASSAKVSGDAKLKAEAKVTEAEARATAMKEVPGGTIRSGELEREGGKLIYSFDIKVAGKSGIEEVNVDAMTGSVLAHEHESPKAEKKEAAQDKKSAKKP